MTTAMQVASRVTMVWYVCDQYPQVRFPRCSSSSRVLYSGRCLSVLRLDGVRVVPD